MARKSTQSRAYADRILTERSMLKDTLDLTAGASDPGLVFIPPDSLMVSQVTLTIKG